MSAIEWIFCCGFIRSGSTLQYQIASELVERSDRGTRCGYLEQGDSLAPYGGAPIEGLRVLKSHFISDEMLSLLRAERAVVLYTYRDIPDVFSSAMRSFSKGHDELIDSGWLEFSHAQFLKIKDDPSLFLSNYDRLYDSLGDEVARLVDFLNLQVDPILIDEVTAFLSIGEQIKRASAVASDTFSGDVYDAKHLLHKNHISNPEPGSSLHQFTQYQLERIKGLYSPIIEDFRALDN